MSLINQAFYELKSTQAQTFINLNFSWIKFLKAHGAWSAWAKPEPNEERINSHLIWYSSMENLHGTIHSLRELIIANMTLKLSSNS